jgi:outer membrane receptor protein involved in Fe transport
MGLAFSLHAVVPESLSPVAETTPQPLSPVAETTPQPSSEAVFELEVVRVRSVRPKSSSPVFESVPLRNSLARGASLGNLAAILPSVYLGGAPGEDKDLRLRGLDKEFNAILYDGMPYSDGGEKREVKLDRIPAAMVERVELHRGPSAEMPGHGLAGILNVVPKDSFDGILLRGMSSTEDFRIHDLALVAGYEGEGWNPYLVLQELGTRVNLKRTENTVTLFSTGLPKERVEVKGSENKIKAARAGQVGLSYRQGSWRAGLSLGLNSATEDKAKEQSQRKYNAAGTLKEALSEPERELKREDAGRVLLSGEWRFWEGAGKLNLDGSFTQGKEEKEKFKSTFKGATSTATTVLVKGTVETESKPEELYALRLKSDLGRRADWHGQWQMGLAYDQRDRLKVKKVIETNAAGVSTDKSGVKDRYSLRETVWAGFAMLEKSFWEDRVRLVPGLRVEDSVGEQSVPGQTDARGEAVDFLPSARLEVEPWAGQIAYVVMGQSLQRPKFDDMVPFREVGGADVKVGNPDLNPARAFSLETGLKSKLVFFEIEANYYRREIRGLIQEVTVGTDAGTGKPLIRLENYGEGTASGLELGLAAAGGRWGRVGMRYSRLWSETRDPLSGMSGTFKDVPPWVASLSVELWPDARWSFEAIGSLIGALRSKELKKTEIVDKSRGQDFRLDVSASRQIYKGFSLLLKATDLLASRGRVETESKLNLGNGETSVKEKTETPRGPELWAGIEAKF